MRRRPFPSYAPTIQYIWSVGDHANAPIWHGQGGTLVSEKVERIFSGVIATICGI